MRSQQTNEEGIRCAVLQIRPTAGWDLGRLSVLNQARDRVSVLGEWDLQESR